MRKTLVKPAKTQNTEETEQTGSKEINIQFKSSWFM